MSSTMLFHKIFLSLSTVSVGQGAMVYQVSLLLFINRVMIQISVN